jgi:hypothetical protein
MVGDVKVREDVAGGLWSFVVVCLDPLMIVAGCGATSRK